MIENMFIEVSSNMRGSSIEGTLMVYFHSFCSVLAISK